MDTNELIQIGFLRKPHGLKGEMRVSIDEQWWDDFEDLKVLFIDNKGRPMPHFIATMRGSLPEPIISFEEIDSPEKARLLAHKPVMARTADLPNGLSDNTADEDQGVDIRGFTLVDPEWGEIGPIQDVMDLPGHELAIVLYKENEIMIPVHQDLIMELDEKKKTIMIQIPDGLLDLGS